MQPSVVIVARDEADRIAQCLESVHLFTDKVVMVDDRTTDDTAKVAKEHGASVFKEKFLNYSQIKNQAIAKAKSTWVLLLDADERPTPELIGIIKHLADQENIDGYQIAFKNFLGSKWLRYGGMYPDYHIRLFRRSAIYSGEVHERLNINPARVATLEGDIIHLTYKSSSELFEKVKRYASLEASGKQKSYLMAYQKLLKRWLGVYFLRKGFLDGVEGLIHANAMAYYQYLMYRP